MNDRNLSETPSSLSRSEREALTGGPGIAIWFTGLSGAGKTTLARGLELRIAERGRLACVLDGDTLRNGLNGDLGFGPEGRRENIRRAGELCRLLVENSLIAIAAFISPYERDRHRARELLPAERFLEVHVATPLETCRARDPKGLYGKAERGEIPHFTGVSSPYEAPSRPELTIDTSERNVESCLDEIVAALDGRGVFSAEAETRADSS